MTILNQLDSAIYMDKIGCNDEHMSNSPNADNLKFILKGSLNKLIIARLRI